MVEIKMDLPNYGDYLIANIDEGTMYVDIKRSDKGYSIDVWDRAGDPVNSLTIYLEELV